MSWRSIVAVVALVVLSPYLWDYARAVRLMIVNRPFLFQETTGISWHQVRFADHLRNCEDVVLDTQSGFALLSCSPGRDKWNTVMGMFIDPSEHGSIYLYPYAERAEEPPIRLPLTGFSGPFHPLGMAYHAESGTVAITNHGGHDATVELFDFDPEERALTFRRSLVDSTNLRTPNSITFINATHAFISNTHRLRVKSKPQTLLERAYLGLSKIELKSGLPTGSVSLVNLETGGATKVIDLGFANGVDLLDHGRTLAVAGTNKASVYLYNITDSPAKPRFIRRLNLPFFPDNLSVDDRGHIFVAGHPDPRALDVMIHGNWRCHSEKTQCFQSPSWVVEWSPSQASSPGQFETLYSSLAWGSSSGAAYDSGRNTLIVVGLYADGILVGQK